MAAADQSNDACEFGSILRSWKAFTLSILTILLPKTANAEWQYAQWEMTPSEVVSASGGLASYPKSRVKYGGNYFHGVSALHSIGDLKFDVHFLFDMSDDALRVVRLETRDKGRCRQLKSKLDKLLGPPFTSESTFLGKQWDWNDRKHKDLVSLVDYSMTCSVTYRDWKRREE